MRCGPCSPTARVASAAIAETCLRPHIRARRCCGRLRALAPVRSHRCFRYGRLDERMLVSSETPGARARPDSTTEHALHAQSPAAAALTSRTRPPRPFAFRASLTNDARARATRRHARRLRDAAAKFMTVDHRIDRTGAGYRGCTKKSCASRSLRAPGGGGALGSRTPARRHKDVDEA